MLRYIYTLEAWVTIGLFSISLAFFVSAYGLPAGVFDPLGPGSVPEMVSALLCFLCLIVIVRGFTRAQSGTNPQGEDAVDIIKREGQETPYALVGFFGFLVLYLLAFQWELGHFITITVPFVFATILLLNEFTLRNGIIALVIAVGLSVGFYYVMTDFFVIRLPGI
ncbi:MAG: tripartite tricarboxylate transporter TctB family protein [Pseudomonadota bacterium]